MELLERFVAGDLDAFEALFRQDQAEVYRWIVRIVRDPGVAEDLTVETFWRVHRAHARFDAKGNWGAWLRRIATNASLDHLRRARREVELPEDLAAPARADGAVQSELHRQIRRALQELPPRLRIVAILSLVEEEPLERIAAALGISKGAAKLRLFRGARLLRKKLERMGVKP
jgi:RNA polymerase sigma-70 factor (ECF subfamily)